MSYCYARLTINSVVNENTVGLQIHEFVYCINSPTYVHAKVNSEPSKTMKNKKELATGESVVLPDVMPLPP